MKKILIQYAVSALAAALMVPLAQAQPAGIQAAFAKDAGTLSEKFTGLARVMSGKYDWKPAQGVRSVADVFKTALPPARKQTPAPGTSFRDCSNGCPEMVVVPQGRFTMGAPAGEEARENWPIERRGRSVPQHLVTIRHKLAIAKFEVTRDEYAQFVAETNRPDADSCDTLDASGDFIATNGNWHSPGFPQTGRDHVACVSWDDTQAYVAWLSAKTGYVYRLPTDAEWEYAARAGTTTERYFSDNPAALCLS